MKTKKAVINITIMFMIIILIIDSKSAIFAAQNGINMCIESVIPSLFPMIFLTSILSDSFDTTKASGILLIFALGAISGYPVGAQLVYNLYFTRQITHEEEIRMLPVCNNAGPAFILGITGMLFSKAYIPILIWMIQIISALIIYFSLPTEKTCKLAAVPTEKRNLKEHLIKATSIATVCGWVILFRILIVFLKNRCIGNLPCEYQAFIAGMFELTNGCIDLFQIHSESVRFIYCCTLLPFGGLCVIMQTASVAPGFPISTYIFGKIAQASFCAILGLLTAPKLFSESKTYTYFLLFPLIFIYFISIFLLRRKINVAKSSNMLYN